MAQVAAYSSSSVKWLENSLSKFGSEKQIPNYFEIFSDYVQTSLGTYRLFKVLTAGCKIPLHFAQKIGLDEGTIKILVNAQNRFKFLAKGMILTKIPFDIKDIKKSYTQYQKIDVKKATRARDKLARKIVQAVADCGFLVKLGELFCIYSLGSFGLAVDFIANTFMLSARVIYLKMTSEDIYKDRNFINIIQNQKSISQRLQILVYEIKNLDLISLAQAVFNVAVSVFVVAEIGLGTALISESAMLFLSTAALVTTIWSHFYKESMTYPLN